MRDAFGGAFMIKIFLVFIFIYICFTAIALNYAKAFKVKNIVIDYLESNEIMNIGELNASEMQAMEYYFEQEILNKLNYNIDQPGFCDSIGVDLNKDYCENGIVIRFQDLTDAEYTGGEYRSTEGVYHTVETYVGWSTGFLQPLLSLNGNNERQDSIAGYWKISGQTRVLYHE